MSDKIGAGPSQSLSQSKALLSASGIGKSFGPQQVLSEVDFDLLPGEVHILSGENGAGKSTLIKIFAGVHTEYEGHIEMEGRPVRFRGPLDAAQRGISVIHQELSLIPSMNVVDNIFLGRERTLAGHWMNFSDQRQSCRDLLKRLDLDLDISQPVGSFSLSVQQTLEIAKALAFEARILIMDEPTSALSDPEVERLFSIIDSLKAQGYGIVYISHKMEEIYRIADRITVLRDGKKIATTPASQLSHDELVHQMVGRELGEQFPRHTPSLGDERLSVKHLSLDDPQGLRGKLVDNVSFSVRRGEILGIGGLQGSGASELLGALFGVYGRMARGEVLLDGQPFQPGAPLRSIEQGLALLTNDRKTTGLVLGMSIARNITLASVPKYSPGHWFCGGKEREAATRQKQALGIKAADLQLPVETLSGGNQQKVALAKWLETEPKVLLLDEPTRGVDVGAKREIYELMNDWTRQGYAIVLITSEMPELLALSDRIIVMHRGQITAELSGSEATQESILHAAMGHADIKPGENQ